MKTALILLIMFYITSGFTDNGVKYNTFPPNTQEIFDLKIHLKNNQLIVQWISSTEMCGDYFLVEKSSNARDWYEITSAIAYGNNNELYTEIDETFDGETCYYRVIQVHLDRSMNYSEILEFNSNQEN